MSDSVSENNEKHLSLMLGEIVSDDYKCVSKISGLSKQFKRDGYVALPSLFNNEVMDFLKLEVGRLDAHREYRDFIMPGYDSPRNLSVVGGQKILNLSGLLLLLYAHSDVRNLVEGITAEKIYTINNVNEFMVVNYLEGPGHTHGWHLDDPCYALIIIVDSSYEEEGGCLEYINDWPEICARNGLEPISSLMESEVVRFKSRKDKFITGDCYLLNAANCLHRVTALKRQGSRRVALNMAYHNSMHVNYGITAKMLYGEQLNSV